MNKHDKRHEEHERFPGVDPIPDPEPGSPSSTDMIEDVLEEGYKSHKPHPSPSEVDDDHHK